MKDACASTEPLSSPGARREAYAPKLDDKPKTAAKAFVQLQDEEKGLHKSECALHEKATSSSGNGMNGHHVPSCYLEDVTRTEDYKIGVTSSERDGRIQEPRQDEFDRRSSEGETSYEQNVEVQVQVRDPKSNGQLPSTEALSDRLNLSLPNGDDISSAGHPEKESVQKLIRELKETIVDMGYQLEASNKDLSRLKKELTDRQMESKKDQQTIQTLSEEVKELRNALRFFEDQSQFSPAQKGQTGYETPPRVVSNGRQHSQDGLRNFEHRKSLSVGERRVSFELSETSHYPRFSNVYSSDAGSSKLNHIKPHSCLQYVSSFSSEEDDTDHFSFSRASSSDLESYLTHTQELLTMFGVAPLLQALQSEDEQTREIVAKSLADLSERHESRADMAMEEGVPILVSALSECSFDTSTMAFLLATIANLTTETASHNKIVKCGGVHILAWVLDNSIDLKCQSMSACALANLCTKSFNTNALVDGGGVKALISVISSSNKNVIAHVVRGLANIFRFLKNPEVFIDESLVVGLLLLCGSQNVDVVRHVAIIIYYISKSSLARGMLVRLNGLSIIESMTVVREKNIDKLANMILEHFAVNP